MPVTKARKLNIKAEDLGGSGGQSSKYDTIEVPGDYELTATDVNEYPKEGKPKGWKVEYDLDGLPFSFWLPWSEAARWKIVQAFEAHGISLDEGVAEVDPNALIGGTVGGHIDFGKPNDDGKSYREIKYVFSLDNIPGYEDEEPEVEDVTLDDDVEEPEIL